MRNWIAVANADHVARGVAGGFMQVCHGKAAPLRRVKPGDCVAYYAPHSKFGGADALQSFVAIGQVADSDVVQVDMGDGFHPWRRPVEFWPARPASIHVLRSHPDFFLAGPNWGAKLRFGLLAIDGPSMAQIADAMQVAPCFLHLPSPESVV